MSNRKKREALPRDLEIRGAEIFGKHLSPEKQRALLIVTLTACALPMILGVRMWDRIPEIVETGLIGPGGQDDSLPPVGGGAPPARFDVPAGGCRAVHAAAVSKADEDPTGV